MRRFLTLIAAMLWLMPAGVASATMILQSYDAKKHDRFYVGADKAFIGAPYDWSGVGRNDYWATMVSDHYFLSANHYHASVGSNVKFSLTNDPNGAYEIRTIASGMRIAGSDLWLGKLSEPVSANVAKYSILSLAQESSYDDLALYTYGLSDKSPVRLGRNNVDPGRIQNAMVDGVTGRVFLYDYDKVGGQGADESYLQGGDSGGPSFVVSGGQPTLVGIHWFTWDDETASPKIIGSGDTFVPHYVAAINQAMVGEQLTLVPEPSMLVLLCVGTIGLLAGTLRRRTTSSLRPV